MKTIYRKWIGDRLRHYRAKHKLSQLQLAHDVGLLESTWRAYEEGRAEPSIYTLHKACNVFRVKLDTFLKGSPIDDE